jgi:hypothetical protein
MDRIIAHINDWFQSKKTHFTIFAEHDSRLEGWFKAELLVLLEDLKKQGIVTGFKREVKTYLQSKARRQVDFSLTFEEISTNDVADVRQWCELKALCISRKNTNRGISFYFRDDKLGLPGDFRKLNELPQRHKWVIAFIYPPPSQEEWDAVKKIIPEDLKEWRCLTNPVENEAVFVSVWKCERMDVVFK